MPNRYDELRAWLASTIGHPDFGLEPASTEASFRRYFRVSHGGESFIVMDAPPEHEDCGPFLAVTELLHGAGVNAPQIIARQPERGFLLLGDLGTRQYFHELNDDRADALYSDALDALFRMQTRIAPERVPPYSEQLLREELGLFPTWFLARHLGIPKQHPIHALLGPCFDALCAVCGEQPQVFVHRDFHSRNLMVQARDNPGVLDYQDAVTGPVAYDLVSLLRDVYIRWPEERVHQWVHQYREQAVAGDVLTDPGPEMFLRWFDLTGLQRHLKIVGIFARLYYRDGKPGYLPDIDLALRYVLEVGGRYDASKALAEALQDLDVRSRLRQRNAAVLDTVDA